MKQYIATVKSDSITQQGVELGKFDGAFFLLLLLLLFVILFYFIFITIILFFKVLLWCQYEHLYQLGLSILLTTIVQLVA